MRQMGIGSMLLHYRSVKRLIINADDFGLTPGVNRAVLELQRAGALSSATLMANGDSFMQAVHLAFARPSLGIGAHIVLIDGYPYLHPEEVPSLIDPLRRELNMLRPTIASFVQDLMRGRIRERDIQAEAIAQIRRIQKSGFTVSHVDSHKHLHAFPRALAPILRAAQHCGVPSVRNPFEPSWSRRVTGKTGTWRRMQVHAIATQHRSWCKMVADYGMHTTDGALGVLGTGILDQAMLRSLLTALPEGVWELVCHPGYNDAELQQARTRLLESREVERTALLNVVPEVLRQHRDIALIDFHQLAKES
jgi:chitin disaccharide deacetylase